MTAANHPGSHKDCFDLFERALESPRGIRIQMADGGAAMNLRTRLNMARTLDRVRNTEIYEPSDPMYGASEFDKLQVSVRKTWVSITHVNRVPLVIEEIAAE